MIDIRKYNQRQNAYHTFCILLDYVKEKSPSQLRNPGGHLKGRKELHSIIQTIKT